MFEFGLSELRVGANNWTACNHGPVTALKQQGDVALACRLSVSQRCFVFEARFLADGAAIRSLELPDLQADPEDEQLDCCDVRLLDEPTPLWSRRVGFEDIASVDHCGDVLTILLHQSPCSLCKLGGEEPVEDAIRFRPAPPGMGQSSFVAALEVASLHAPELAALFSASPVPATPPSLMKRCGRDDPDTPPSAKKRLKLVGAWDAGERFESPAVAPWKNAGA